MWYVYFLELSNNDIYIEHTRDLKQRFESHNNGNVISTKDFLPAKLKSYIAVNQQDTAINLENT